MRQGWRFSVVLGVGCLLLSQQALAEAPPTPIQQPIEAEAPDWLLPSCHSAAILVATRAGLSLLWPEAYDPSQFASNWESFKGSYSGLPEFDSQAAFFEWDGDPWPINLLGHGLMGAEFYLSHRRAGHSWVVALGMSAAWSSLWEYGIESWYQQPSGIDLLWTPLGGALIGEGRYQLLTWVEDMEASAGRKALLYLIDPLGELERDLMAL